MKDKLQLFLLTVIIGLSAGLILPRLLQGDGLGTAAPAEPDFSLPKDGIVSDAFSIRLLQAAMEESETPLVLVAPAAVTDALLTLRNAAAGASVEEIDALHLSPTLPRNSSSADYKVLLAPEESLKLRGPSCLPLPYRKDFIEAQSLFNMFMPGQRPMADTRFISSDTRLLIGAATLVNTDFLHPFHPKDTRRGDFDNADGRMPSVPMMRCRALFRTAAAEDGSWRAIALLLKAPTGTPAGAFIGILPQGSVRDFARALTPEQLSDIRRALAEAEPQDSLVELPRFALETPTRDLQPLLATLGVSAPFDLRRADFSPLTEEPLALNALPERKTLFITEEESIQEATPDLDGAASVISFNSPFLWLIGDLTTDAPFVLMGLVENM